MGTNYITSKVLNGNDLVYRAYVHLLPEHVNKGIMSSVAASFRQAANDAFKDSQSQAIKQLLESTIVKVNNQEVSAEEFMNMYSDESVAAMVEEGLNQVAQEINDQFGNLPGELTEAINRVHEIISSSKKINSKAFQEWMNEVWKAIETIGVSKEVYETIKELQSRGINSPFSINKRTLDTIDHIVELMNRANQKRLGNTSKNGKKTYALSKRSLKGTTNNILGTDLGEEFGAIWMEKVDPSNFQGKINDAFSLAAANSGGRLTMLSSGKMTVEKTKTVVKSDMICNSPICQIQSSIRGDNISIDCLINTTIKQYADATPESITLVSGTPITTVINILKGGREVSYGVYNTITHAKQFSEAYDSLKSFIAGTFFRQYLMGTGQKIKGTSTTDTAWFMMIGKKVYSVLDIVKDIASDKENSSSIKIWFSKYNINNSPEYGYATTLLNMMARSNRVKNAINEITIKAFLNARFY